MNALVRDGNGGLFNMSYTTEEQSISNFINLLLTRSGERYMQPDFGIGLQWRVFENNTESLRLAIDYDIRLQVKYWLPYIIIREIEMNTAMEIPSLAADHEHGIHIKIYFSVTEVGANRTIVIFKRGATTEVAVN